MATKTYLVSVKGISPYSQSKHYEEPKHDKESSADYEARTWRLRMHTNEAGNVVIPPMQFKKCLEDAAKYLSISIPGKGKATYTKHFKAGVMVVDETPLPIKAEDVKAEWLFVPSDGIAGSGKRVKKCFGVIPSWKAKVPFIILDETITMPVLKQHLDEAGSLIGIGRFRPRNGGFYGRFTVEKIEEQK